MDDEVKKCLDQITNECAKEIINDDPEIREWVESKVNGNNPGTTTKPNTGLKNLLGKKTSD